MGGRTILGIKSNAKFGCSQVPKAIMTPTLLINFLLIIATLTNGIRFPNFIAKKHQINHRKYVPNPSASSFCSMQGGARKMTKKSFIKKSAVSKLISWAKGWFESTVSAIESFVTLPAKKSSKKRSTKPNNDLNAHDSSIIRILKV